MDDQEDGRNEQGFCQKLQQNLAKALEKKVVTKDKF